MFGDYVPIERAEGFVGQPGGQHLVVKPQLVPEHRSSFIKN